LSECLQNRAVGNRVYTNKTRRKRVEESIVEILNVCYSSIRPSYRRSAVNQVVTLEIRDELYTALKQQAESVGISLTEWIAVALEQQSSLLSQPKTDAEKEVARQRFRRHAGSIDLGNPTGTDNVSIDADLVRAYGGDFN